MYADSIYYQTLQTNINAAEGADVFPRPPFAFLFHYYGGWYGGRQWEDIQDVDRYFSESFLDELGLPGQSPVRHFNTDNFPLFPTEAVIGDSAYRADNTLAWVNLAFMDDLENHIDLLEGSLPKGAASSEDEVIEVLVHEQLALELGLQIGEEYIGQVTSETPGGKKVDVEYPIRIAGVWAPTNPRDKYWISIPSFYQNVLFVPEASFMERISPYISDEVFSAYWYFITDGAEVHADDVGRLLVNIGTIEKHTNYLLENIRMSVSPADALWEYRVASRSLTILLYAFSVPILGLILGFVSLVSRLSVERQRNEIAILRSRGASPLQILGLITLEGLILGLISLIISLPLAVR